MLKLRASIIGFSFACLLMVPFSNIHAANTTTPPAKVKGHQNNPCATDIEKFCANTQPGQSRIINCLKSHESELSSACKESRAQLRKAVGEIHQACEEDIQSYCGSVKPGGGRIHDCLNKNQDKLSAACKTELAKVKAKLQKKK